MKTVFAFLAAGCLAIGSVNGVEQAAPVSPPAGRKDASESAIRPPIGQPGSMARYRNEMEAGLRGSVVKTYTLALGPVEQRAGKEYQWMRLHAMKANGEQFRAWLLSAGYPPPRMKAARQTITRYILQEGDAPPAEFRDRFTAEAVLPTQGGWEYLLPRAAGQDDASRQKETFPPETRYLGHRYKLEAVEDTLAPTPPPNARLVELLPDVLIGMPSNTRTKGDTRRYDNSDYELVRLTREDYRQMADAGINCVHVDAEQLRWVDGLNIFYWGGGNDVPYPESLYRSCYLGPALFLDEPAVGTRDYVIRPKLEKDPAFRKALTPQIVFEAFQEYYSHAWQEGAATSLLKGLKARADVDVGDMDFMQENLFVWETVESSAAYELSQDARVPAAMVFEPPGRVGTFRTLPELNMTYGCQIPVDNPKNFTDIIYGFLRGAARLTDKSWGTSIYGAVDQADAFWFMTHAYDLGATRFFFWDTGPTACVPYGECLALARNLRTHAQNFAHRDLQQLNRAAEVAILLPPGYNLGHVQLGKGSLWGLGELNLERVNRKGVKYRTVMSNFFTEIERCLRLGVAFDVLWDLPQVHPSGYREVVRIEEDGRVQIEQDGKRILLDQARTPARPSGIPPQLSVELSHQDGKAPLAVTALASVREKSAPVYYTYGTDTNGVYHNAVVAWEIYGPGDEDHRFLQPAGLKPRVTRKDSSYEVTVNFTLNRPGNYRLRAASVDLAGRATVAWTPMVVTE